MSILRIIWKLMSRHLLPHLIIPLIVGLAVETAIAYSRTSEQFAFGHYLFSGERVGFYLGVFITYLCIAIPLMNKEARPPWDDRLTKQLDKVLKDATGFFATCTVPMKAWFDPYTQQYFSHIVRHRFGPSALPQERVLIFRKRGEYAKAKEQYLDGRYAKPLAEIHKNYGIKLGFLDRDDINQITSHFPSPQLDFALITYANGRAVYTFDKRGPKIKLKVLRSDRQIEPYERLAAAIKAVVFDANGELIPEYTFAP